MLVTQPNLYHCAAAQQLLCQTLSLWVTDIAIILDPYHIAAGSIEIVHAYCMMAEWTGRKLVVVAGDFNAWAVGWGSRFKYQRGNTHLTMLVVLLPIVSFQQERCGVDQQLLFTSPYYDLLQYRL